MTELHRPRVKYVIGPDGSPLTVADLPPTDTKRWVIRRKAEHADRRRVSQLADVDRPARTCRIAHHAHPAISPV